MPVQTRSRLAGGDGSPPAAEPSVKELVKRLADDAVGLIRSEVALAKLEMRDSGRQMALDTAKIAAAMALAAVGGLALTAAAILALGRLFGGLYWAAALLVGAILLVTGAVLAWRGLSGLRQETLKPEATLETLRQDGAWAGDQARQLKERLSS
ncbi:MAG: phage holin family protein [Gemmatimonadota bacterium]